MLNICLFCYINDFAGADTGTSLLSTDNAVHLEGFGYGIYWL